MKIKQKTLRVWELVLLIGLSVALLTAGWLDREQRDLADRVIRLHVIANSDDPEDQALKLLVRDAVLARAEGLYDPDGGMEEAYAALEENLTELAQAGQEAVRRQGREDLVTASLETSWFPTKQYTDFALPAGSYTALKITIGAGEGQNWWCVVFPPLCLGSVSEQMEDTALAGGFTEDQVSLITGESEGYVVKFKAIELWEQFKERVGG